MKLFSIRHFLFPMTLLSFEAVGVQYWGAIFNERTRWLCVGILLLWIIAHGELRNLFRAKAGFLILAYLFWCLCTIAWSEAPELSALKSCAMIMTSVALFCGAEAWKYRNASLGFLLPIVVLALFAGLLDRGAGQQIGSIELYQGLAGNSNYLGAITAMSVPYPLWQAYKSGSHRLRWFFSLGMTAALFGILWLSASRAAVLAALAILGGFVAALNPGKRILALTLVGVIGLGATVAIPAIKTSLYERFVVKGNLAEEGGGALLTRQQVWSDSYDHALQGGLLGGGYGVTIGSTDQFSLGALGLSAVGYGREKGNTQLAIWEETGLVGVTLYGLLVLGIILELGSGFRRIRDPQSKIELGLLLGALIGFLVQSIFEAWWVAPGSAESAYFWAILGASYGTVRRASVEQKLLQPARRGRRAARMASVSAIR